jgi:hypothetical protein
MRPKFSLLLTAIGSAQKRFAVYTPMNDRLRRELERLALDGADSGWAKLAKIEPLRLLERLDRARDMDFPVDDDGRFRPGVEVGPRPR